MNWFVWNSESAKSSVLRQKYKIPSAELIIRQCHPPDTFSNPYKNQGGIQVFNIYKSDLYYSYSFCINFTNTTFRIRWIHAELCTECADSLPHYVLAKTGKNRLNEENTPLLPTGIGERFSQTLSNLGHAALLCRCELPLWECARWSTSTRT